MNKKKVILKIGYNVGTEGFSNCAVAIAVLDGLTNAFMVF